MKPILAVTQNETLKHFRVIPTLKPLLKIL